MGAVSARTSKAPSRRLLGRYEIVAEIARGGMGTVFLARVEGVGGFKRLFAVKLMHRHLASEPQFVHMLLDEARLASQLHHPNAVGVVDVDESSLGLYIVMEYVNGFALDDVLKKLREVPPAERMRIGLRVWLDSVRGLTAAHQLKDDEGTSLGIVHRDVSPQNILVGLDGAGRITDFGVARAAERITSSHPGMIKGKPCYMAPEQARGEATLDARADIFALGIILWEVLTGRMLFENEAGPAVTLVQVVNKPLQPPSTVCAEAAPLDDVCMKALDRALEKRHQDGRSLYEEVEQVAREAGLLATQEEVADFMREAFFEEIGARKSAIKDHLSAIGDASSKEMQESDIYQVPSLKSSPRVERTSIETPQPKTGPWHETPEPQEAFVSESGERVRALTPLSLPPAPTRWRRVAIAFGLIGLLMAGLAVWVMNGREADAAERRREARAQASEEAAAEERLDAENATEAAVAEAVSEAMAEAETQRAAAEALRVAAEAVEVEQAEAERAEVARVAEEARSAEETERARARRRDRTETDMVDPPGMGMGMETMEPGFETNPYLR